VALGEHGLLEWSVLDAQWFGLAQRRKRVFAVLDTGNWQDRPPILLERDSLRGNTTPSRASGQNIAYAIGAGTSSSSAEQYIRDDNSASLAQSPYRLASFGEYAENSAASTLKARYSKDATDLVVCKLSNTKSNGLGISTDNLAYTLDTTTGSNQAIALVGKGGVPFTLAVHGTQDPGTLTEIAHALGRNQGQENVVYTLTERGRPGGQNLEYRSDGTVNALLTPNGGRAGMGIGAIASDTSVRRLTPREYERLQGFPDDYTRIAWRDKPAEHCPDSPRYRALGNSMAVLVMRWIGQQIQTATHETSQMEKAA